jgi:ABC-type molybdenum transport system ATPase subunit/photorepair protein PhrA
VAVTLKRIQGKNWGPFPVLDTCVESLTVVTGQNGHGKSALLAAVRWCLCGGKISMAPSEDLLIRDGSPETSVEMVMGTSAGELVIRRSRKRGAASKLVVMSNGTETAGKNAQEEIWSRIGVSDDSAYTRLSHVDQGEVTAIASATDKERRDTLLSWIGDAMAVWDRGRAGVWAERVDARREVMGLRARIDSISEVIGDGRDVPVIDFSGTRPAEIRVEKLAIRERINRSNRLDTTSRNLERELTRLIHESESMSEPVPFDEPMPVIGDRTAIKRLGTEIAVRQSTRRELLAVVSGDWSGTCPFVGKECQSVDWVHGHRDSVATEISSIDSELVPIRRELTAQTALARELTVWKSRRDAAQNRVSRYAESVTRIGTDITRVQTEIDGLDTAESADQIAELESMATILDGELTRIRLQADDAERIGSAIKARDEARIALTGAESRLATRTEVLSLIDRTAGPKAMASARVESRTNAMLHGTGLVTRLEWDRPTATRVTTCPNCDQGCKTNRKTCPGCGSERPLVNKPDLRIMVTVDGVERDIKYISGGRRQIVCLALRLATCPIDWIVLDEVDSSMDSDMRAHAARVCRTAAGTGLQIVVVSHHPEIAAEADTLLGITRQGNVSVVVEQK